MPDDQNPQEPKTLTPEEIGNLVNSALTARLPKMLAPALEAALKPITEQLAAAKQAPAPPVDDGEGTKSKKSNPELEAVKAQLAQMNQQLENERKQRAEVEQRARSEKAFSEVRSALEGKVRPELADLVAKDLFHFQSRVQFDESGNPTFKATRVPYIGAEPEEYFLPIADGVGEYLKSDAAKPYLPAPSGGSGAGPLPKKGVGTPPPPANRAPVNDAERVARAKQREQAINQRMAGQQ